MGLDKFLREGEGPGKEEGDPSRLGQSPDNGVPLVRVNVRYCRVS